MAALFKDYAGYTTVHGIKDLVTSPNWGAKLVWAVLLLAGTGTMIFETHQVLISFLDRPKATQISQLFLTTYPYPLITFCPNRWINGSRVKQFNLTRTELAYALSYMPLIKSPHPVDSPNETAEIFWRNMNRLGFKSLFDLFLAVSDDSELTLYCSACTEWPGQKAVTEDGVCYHLQMDDAKKYSVDDFTPFLTYRVPDTDDDRLFVPEYGRVPSKDLLYVNMHRDDFYGANSIKFSQNSSYMVKITPMLQRRYSTAGTPCLTKEELLERNISSSRCGSNCEQLVYGVRCWKCVYLGYYVEPLMVDGVEIEPPLWSSLTYQEPDDWEECQNREQSAYKKCTSECGQPCEEWEYTLSTLMSKNPTLKAGYDQVNITIVISYQVKTGTILVEERPSYTWHTFLSNVGGQMGLWLGISILSICQFFFFIVHLLEHHLEGCTTEFCCKKGSNIQAQTCVNSR